MNNLLVQSICKNINRAIKHKNIFAIANLYATSFCTSQTVLQVSVAKLCHLTSNRMIELPEEFSVLKIGKASRGIIPDIDLSYFPYSELVSRNHAEIRFDGEEYFIQDTGSTNGTYINKYPMLPGIWYKIGKKVQISFDKRYAVSFIFEIF